MKNIRDSNCFPRLYIIVDLYGQIFDHNYWILHGFGLGKDNLNFPGGIWACKANANYILRELKKSFCKKVWKTYNFHVIEYIRKET